MALLLERLRAHLDRARLFPAPGDRKSTRLNSSHSQISYAVFCLKKKKRSRASATTTSFAASWGDGSADTCRRQALGQGALRTLAQATAPPLRTRLPRRTKYRCHD